ncbi:MAG: SpoIIE family protein phosphatase [Bacteroides sp.]|nr:SpoIIE family protein phosphatase [Eubacterium sp.]MCM1417892.1 SpoIIE family protein phosphatase [Roseburia sp.]MCM1461944.1 SpoIIE family protein phosphatase [Bacteroides sp.]
MEKSYRSAAEPREHDLELGRSLGAAGVSLLLACTSLFGAPSPLSVIWIASLDRACAIAAFFGGAVGYLVGGGFETAIPYIAVMAVVTALRLLSGHFRGRAAEVLTAVAAAIGVLTAHAVFADGIGDLMTACAFSVVTLICTLSAARLRRLSSAPGTADCLAAGTLYTVLIAAFTALYAAPFNFGIFLSGAAILYLSDYRRGLSSAAAILSAVGIAVGNGGFAIPALILTVSGLIASLLERYSRLTRACGIVFTAGIGVLLTGISEYSASYVGSVLIGSLLYAFLPERFLPIYRNRCTAEVSASAVPYAAFGKKLSGMSAAIGEMDRAIKKTAKALDGREGHDISRVYQSAGEEICRTCKNNMTCWGSCYNRSADIMNKAIQKIRSGALADETMLGGHFAELCDRRKELSQALNKQYAAYRSAESAARKVGEMRALLSVQLGATQKMLDAMSEELIADHVYDPESAEKTCAVLRELGLREPSALAVAIDRKLTVDAYGYGILSVDAGELADRLSFALRKSFDPPMIAENGGQTHITLSERSPYDAQIRLYQKNKADNRRNGDCCDCFNDGQGNVYMILSDGMGSGSRARIDSAFACGMLSKMLKAGIDFDASMEMLNTSLSVKSSDESFATLDVCRVNLYSGEVSLYKAGSAETFVRCGKKFVRLEGSGIPFGVGVPAEYSEKRFFVSAGDVLIMTSDGAELDRDWLEKLTMRDRSADLDAILDTVGEALRLSAEKGKEDDITVIGVKITK